MGDDRFDRPDVCRAGTPAAHASVPDARRVLPARAVRSMPGWAGVVAACCVAAGVVACGPGDWMSMPAPAAGSAALGAAASAPAGPAEGGLAVGPITGFGTVQVGGIRFDDAFARVVDDDGHVRDLKALKLGMTVSVDSDLPRKDEGPTTATASTIRFGSSLLGPIDAVQVDGGRFVVMGREVRTDPATVFDDRIAGGRGGLQPGMWVEVYASARGGDELVATRIEPASPDAVPKLSGHVTQLDARNRMLRIDGRAFDYDTLAAAASLNVGQWVTVRLQAVPAQTARPQVRSFAAALQPPSNRDAAQISGRVTNWTSPASFRVENTLVDASRAMYPDGAVAAHPDAKVVVVGALVNGVLQARTVRIDTGAKLATHATDGTAVPPAAAGTFELSGSVESVDVERQKVQIHGEVVKLQRDDGRPVDWSRGALRDLAPGKRVTVQAEPVGKAAGLQAQRVDFR